MQNEWRGWGSFCLPTSLFDGREVCIDYHEKYFIFSDNRNNLHYLAKDTIHMTLYDPAGNERDTETYFLLRKLLLQPGYPLETDEVGTFLFNYDYDDLVDYEEGTLKKQLRLQSVGRQ